MFLIQLTKGTREFPIGSIEKIWGPFASEEEAKKEGEKQKENFCLIKNLIQSGKKDGCTYLVLLVHNRSKGISDHEWTDSVALWGPFASEEEAGIVEEENKNLLDHFWSLGDKWNPQTHPEFQVFSGGITPPKDM